MSTTEQQSPTTDEKSYLQTNLIIGLFVITFAGKNLVYTSQNQIKVSATLESNEQVPFDHPFFQMLAAYIGEFIFTIFYYLYKAFVMQHNVKQSEVRFFQFFYPAICDFTENLLFIYGLGNILPSLTIVPKALAVPISIGFSRWSVLRLSKNYNIKQIVSIMGIMAGTVWIFFSSFGGQNEWFQKEQTVGFIMITVSAIIQAFEISLENRLFNIDKDLTALTLQQAISIWKVLLIFIMFVITNIWADTLGALTKSNTENIGLAIKNMNEQKELYVLMFFIMFLNALAANLGMQIVKDENAVVKQSIMLLPLPLLWVYHIFYGDKKDKFDYIKLVGQILMVTSILFYIGFDRQAISEEKGESASSNRNGQQSSRRENTEMAFKSGLPTQSEADEESLMKRKGESNGSVKSLGPVIMASGRREDKRFDTNQLMSDEHSSAPEHSDDGSNSGKGSDRMQMRSETKKFD